MSLAIIHSRAQAGIEAPADTVETNISNSLPGLSIVGLPEVAVHSIASHQHYLANWQTRSFRAATIPLRLQPWWEGASTQGMEESPWPTTG